MQQTQRERAEIDACRGAKDIRYKHHKWKSRRKSLSVAKVVACLIELRTL